MCGAPLQEGPPSAPPPEQMDSEPEVPESSVKRWLWEVVSLLSLTAAAILFAIDLASGFHVTWSLIPISAIAFLWACASVAIALARSPLALLAALTAALVGFLFVLELITPGRPWFLQLALPQVGIAIVMGVVLWTLVSRLRLSLLPAIAVVVLGCGFLAVGAEYILNRYLGSDTVVSWSLVVLACALSLFLAVLVIHRRLREKHSDIRRLFHL